MLGLLALGQVACDSILGLGRYSNCDSDCPGTTDAGPALPDVAPTDVVVYEGALGDATDASDAGDASDVFVEEREASLLDVTPEFGPPTAAQTWINWPMPNPDAAVAPGADAMLPHPMAYSSADDAGSAYVYDSVTHLAWETGPGAPVNDFRSAAAHCANLPLPALGGGWRVPTRIELVSVIDFTRQPTIATDAFLIDGGGSGSFWTSSLYHDPTMPAGASARHWVVNFADGTVIGSGSAQWVRCVFGPS